MSKFSIGLLGTIANRCTSVNALPVPFPGFANQSTTRCGATQEYGYPFSGLNRAIVEHALQQAGLAGHSLHAVSGLPVSAFYL